MIFPIWFLKSTENMPGFFLNSIIASTLVGIVCSVIGVYIILKGIAFIGSGIAHSAFAGVAIGLLFGINPILSSMIFCIAVAVMIGITEEITRVKADVSIGIFFASTMALGVIITSFLRGYNTQIFGILFGNILAVRDTDIVIIIITAIFVLSVVFLLRREFLFIIFDYELSRASGLKSFYYYLIMLALIAMASVISLKIVGIILVSALLILPAAIANQLTYSFKSLMLLSVIFGIIITNTGFFLSYMFDLPSGATIVLFGTFLFFIVFLLSPKRKKYPLQ